MTYQVASDVVARLFAVIEPGPLDAKVPRAVGFSFRCSSTFVQELEFLTLSKPSCSAAKDVIDGTYSSSKLGVIPTKRFTGALTFNIAVGIVLVSGMSIEGVWIVASDV
jgi:hypothetical protein